jgi:pyruvate/2-oxoglutarate dehydrogenase complex dihydrolipoamide dehydrogenase (E3) component
MNNVVPEDELKKEYKVQLIEAKEKKGGLLTAEECIPLKGISLSSQYQHYFSEQFEAKKVQARIHIKKLVQEQISATKLDSIKKSASSDYWEHLALDLEKSHKRKKVPNDL